MDEYRKEEIDAKLAQLEIAIEAFLAIADAPFFEGSGMRQAAEKIRALQAKDDSDPRS
jgi:hypothetical protein